MSSRPTSVPRRRRSGRRDFGAIVSEGTPTAPSFAVRWYEGGKRRRKRGFESRTEAGGFLARVRSGMGDGTLEISRRAEALFTDVGAEWLKLHSKALRSHKENQIRWDLRIKDWFGTLSLSKITPAKVLAFKEYLLADADLGDATKNQYLQQVRAILRWAVATGYIATAPTERLRKLLIPLRPEKLSPPIERPEDVGRLLQQIAVTAEKYACPSYPALFATAVYTGMRRGELCGLRWSDVKLEQRTIVVRRSHAGATKSGKGRVVPIASALLPILSAWKLQQGKSELVFPNDHAGLWDAPEMHSKDSAARLARHLAEACGEAKPPIKAIRFHDLRHIFASHFVMNGGDLLTLQRILGHSTPTITGEVYSHLAPSHLVKESDRVRFDAPAGKVAGRTAAARVGRHR